MRGGCINLAKTEIFYTKEDVELLKTTAPPSKKFENLIGQEYGQLRVIEFCGRKDKHSWWFCECPCGNIIQTSSNRLRGGKKIKCSSCTSESYSDRRYRGDKYYLKIIYDKLPNISIVSSVKNNGSEPWEWYCNGCDVNFKAVPTNMILPRYKHTPCLCGKGAGFRGWTKELREVRQILPLCKENNLTFLGWVDSYKNSVSRIKVMCSKHKPWDTRLNNFINGFGCPYCADEKPPSNKNPSDIIISKGYSVHGDLYRYDNFVYKCSRTPSDIFCTRCNSTFKQSYDNHINKRKGCPECKGRGYNKNLAGYFYIQSLDDTYIKFGITNIGAQYRMQEQSSKSIFEHKILYEWYFEDGNIPDKMERTVKDNFTCKVCSKEDMPSGYTETCRIEELPSILTTLKIKGFI